MLFPKKKEIKKIKKLEKHGLMTLTHICLEKEMQHIIFSVHACSSSYNDEE